MAGSDIISCFFVCWQNYMAVKYGSTSKKDKSELIGALCKNVLLPFHFSMKIMEANKIILNSLYYHSLSHVRTFLSLWIKCPLTMPHKLTDLYLKFCTCRKNMAVSYIISCFFLSADKITWLLNMAVLSTSKENTSELI